VFSLAGFFIGSTPEVVYAVDMKNILILLLLCLSSNLMAAEFYKWVDREGVTHYTATPPQQGAQKLELREPTYYTPRKLPDSIYTDKKPGSSLPSAHSYKSLKFLSPENNGTIRSNEGVIDFSLSVEPALQAGDMVKISLDGKLMDQALQGLRHTLTNMDRGSHTLQALIENDKGKVLIRSDTISFHLRKHSIKPKAPAPAPAPERNIPLLPSTQ